MNDDLPDVLRLHSHLGAQGYRLQDIEHWPIGAIGLYRHTATGEEVVIRRRYGGLEVVPRKEGNP